MSNEWDGSLRDARTRGNTPLGSESSFYYGIKCSVCPFSSTCPSCDLSDQGCGFRKQIYDQEFTKIEFNTKDHITLNRLKLITKYFVELHLLRALGQGIDSKEVQLLKTTLSEMSKLYVDKKGDLVDEKSKVAVPWEADQEVIKIKKELEESKSLKKEVEILRAKLKARESSGERVDTDAR
jgi:hypothetical protein